MRTSPSPLIQFLIRTHENTTPIATFLFLIFVRLSVCTINPHVPPPHWFFKHSFCCLLQKSLTTCLKQFMPKLNQSRRKKCFIHSLCVQLHKEERNRQHPFSTILSRFCFFIFWVYVSLAIVRCVTFLFSRRFPVPGILRTHPCSFQ